MAEVEDTVGSVHVFHGIARDGLERIAEIASEETHEAGRFIFREGEQGDKLYLILEGKVRISRRLEGTGEEALAVLGPGEAFGEMSLLDEVPRSADAVVHETCKVLVLAREAFEDLLFLNKDLAYEILWNVVRLLARRLRDTNEKMTFLSATGRF